MADINLTEDLKGLTKEQLLEEWLHIFKTQAPDHLSKAYLIKQIAWSLQYEPLPKAVQTQLDKLMSQYARARTITSSEIKKSSKFEVTAGTRFIREYKGKKHEVTVSEKGFDYCGKTYKSLSAIANEISGTRWNGKKFFGVA